MVVNLEDAVGMVVVVAVAVLVEVVVVIAAEIANSSNNSSSTGNRCSGHGTSRSRKQYTTTFTRKQAATLSVFTPRTRKAKICPHLY